MRWFLKPKPLSKISGNFFDGPWSILVALPPTCVLFRNGGHTHVSYRFNLVTARTRAICWFHPGESIAIVEGHPTFCYWYSFHHSIRPIAYFFFQLFFSKLKKNKRFAKREPCASSGAVFRFRILENLYRESEEKSFLIGKTLAIQLM